MAAKKYVQALTQYLAGSGVVIGATSVTLTSFTDIYGNAITAITSFGDKGYITFEPDTTNEEAATFTSVTVNANGTVTLGGLSTVLAQSPYTETSGLVRSHSGGTKLVITDNVAFWNTFGNKNNDEVITGRWSTTTVPLNANDLATKSYADGLAIAGSPDSSTTTKGITKMSVAPVSPTSPIAVGDNDTRVPTAAQAAALASVTTPAAGNQYMTRKDFQNAAEVFIASTGSANAYLVSYSPGPNALIAGMVLRFKANFANTGAATIAVNAGAAQAIKKVDGATALASGDIANGQLVELVYDGTNFQMLNPVGNAPILNSGFKNGTTTHDISVSGPQTIAHGLGITPKYVKLTIIYNSGVTASIGIFVYNGSTLSAIGSGFNPGGTSTGQLGLGTAIGNSTSYTTLTVSSFDNTNINLSWALTNGPTGTAQIMWEAFA